MLQFTCTTRVDFPPNGTHWLKCFRTHELNHAVTSAGHQCHHLGAELKIMGSLRFKNSLYCSFSRHKLLWSHRGTQRIYAQHLQPGGGEADRQSQHDQNYQKKQKKKQEHIFCWRMRQWFILNRKKRQTADRNSKYENISATWHNLHRFSRFACVISCVFKSVAMSEFSLNMMRNSSPVNEQQARS